LLATVLHSLSSFIIHNERQSWHGGPFCSKNLGDLSKDNPSVNELLSAILKAVETTGIHKITGRKQGVSSFISAAVDANVSNLISFLGLASMDSGGGSAV
jgi:hypothetical protein